MQYSAIKILNNQVIIDKKEGHFLNAFIKDKAMPVVQDFKEKGIRKQVVYGAILHNEGCESINHRQGLGKLFAYPCAEGYKQLSILDLHLTPTLMSGGLTFTPFAALVKTDVEPDPVSDQCLSAFIIYDNMDIITNLINRECIYSIKEIQSSSPDLDVRNWKKGIDESRLMEVALSIK